MSDIYSVCKKYTIINETTEESIEVVMYDEYIDPAEIRHLNKSGEVITYMTFTKDEIRLLSTILQELTRCRECT